MSKACLGPVATAAVRAGEVSAALVELTLWKCMFPGWWGDPGEVREANLQEQSPQAGKRAGIGAPGEEVAFRRIRLSALILIGWKADSEMLQI